jgi:hypothetical protein
LLPERKIVRSDFNKETGEGYYAFDRSDVFEALSLWCANKGINLKDRQIVSFDCSGDPHFTVELEFVTKK